MFHINTPLIFELTDNTHVKVHIFIISHNAIFVKVKQHFLAFIDGTVEGTSISEWRLYSNRTYYGGACDNPWDSTAPEYGGSTVSCSIKILEPPLEEEAQKVGTYYSYDAATSSSRSTISTDNSNVPDTFCPLGWQLPYGGTDGDYYDKSKSFQFLLLKYFSSLQGANSRLYPINTIRSGDLYQTADTLALYRTTINGVYWTMTVKNAYNNYRLFTGTSYSVLHDTDGNHIGNAIR